MTNYGTWKTSELKNKFLWWKFALHMKSPRSQCHRLWVNKLSSLRPLWFQFEKFLWSMPSPHCQSLWPQLLSLQQSWSVVSSLQRCLRRGLSWKSSFVLRNLHSQKNLHSMTRNRRRRSSLAAAKSTPSFNLFESSFHQIQLEEEKGNSLKKKFKTS